MPVPTYTRPVPHPANADLRNTISSTLFPAAARSSLNAGELLSVRKIVTSGICSSAGEEIFSSAREEQAGVLMKGTFGVYVSHEENGCPMPVTSADSVQPHNKPPAASTSRHRSWMPWTSSDYASTKMCSILPSRYPGDRQAGRPSRRCTKYASKPNTTTHGRAQSWRSTVENLLGCIPRFLEKLEVINTTNEPGIAHGREPHLETVDITVPKSPKLALYDKLIRLAFHTTLRCLELELLVKINCCLVDWPAWRSLEQYGRQDRTDASTAEALVPHLGVQHNWECSGWRNRSR
ncbi:hypothetical protein FN846DRAFT_729524 [Sphaerosporella brunnea]|uniref:Uncharacterized protein n=1 Tax=Sphaerosporella brunnea TaxID=1250544 RepID=A0A5J5EW26_9PEZI|nr:hypothetical protein FN846DRAFT_729524 [Sphaerosporella brunnea]